MKKNYFIFEKREFKLVFLLELQKKNIGYLQKQILHHYVKENKLKVAIYKEDANIEIASSIREALINNRIICYYQPILNLSNGKITKY